MVQIRGKNPLSWATGPLGHGRYGFQEQGLEALSNCDPEAEHRLLYQARGVPGWPLRSPGDEFIVIEERL